jgi:hypothetical protein
MRRDRRRYKPLAAGTLGPGQRIRRTSSGIGHLQRVINRIAVEGAEIIAESGVLPLQRLLPALSPFHNPEKARCRDQSLIVAG